MASPSSPSITGRALVPRAPQARRLRSSASGSAFRHRGAAPLRRPLLRSFSSLGHSTGEKRNGRVYEPPQPRNASTLLPPRRRRRHRACLRPSPPANRGDDHASRGRADPGRSLLARTTLATRARLTTSSARHGATPAASASVASSTHLDETSQHPRHRRNASNAEIVVFADATTASPGWRERW